jgi:wobble nucleotide-excising tRNase
MIKRFNRIKQFGVFENFVWGDLPEFTSRNILYGWNYSGKTTLSRVLSCVENNAMHGGYKGAEFEIELARDIVPNTISSNNLEAPSLVIRVFNEDFVSQNQKCPVKLHKSMACSLFL